MNEIFRDRNRNYNGQPHTNEGIRGSTEVKSITMRDLTDCLRIALYESCGSPNGITSVYDLDISKCDPVTIEQNLTCNVEKFMGVYPNTEVQNERD